MSIRWRLELLFRDKVGSRAHSGASVFPYYLPQSMVYVAAAFTAPDGTWLEGEELYAFYMRLLDTFSAPPMLELRRRLTPDAFQPSTVVC